MTVNQAQPAKSKQLSYANVSTVQYDGSSKTQSAL